MTLSKAVRTFIMFSAALTVASAGTIVISDFEGPNNLSACTTLANSPCTDYTKYVGIPDDSEGRYAIINRDPASALQPSDINNRWVNPVNPRPGGSGNQYMLINGSTNPGVDDNVWRAQVGGLTIGSQYNFEAWVVNVCCTVASGIPQNLAQLSFQYSLDGLGWTNIASPSFGATPGIWSSVGGSFTAPATSLYLRLTNTQGSANGNDFGVDDISISDVPEPSSFALFGIGAAAIAFRLRRRK